MFIPRITGFRVESLSFFSIFRAGDETLPHLEDCYPGHEVAHEGGGHHDEEQDGDGVVLAVVMSAPRTRGRLQSQN